MIYTVIMDKSEGNCSVATNEDNVPITVEEMTVSSQPEDAAITVLDLSNPRDVAMVTEAGYSIVDISSSTYCNDSTCDESSDAFSLGADDISLSDLDPEIARAVRKSAETGSIIPLLKEELKNNIQQKRLQAGKGILKIENAAKKRCAQLTPAEEDRRLSRRERNKVAAQKCRAKRQVLAGELENESTVLISKNDILKDEIDKLQEEREMLTNMLRTHDICPRTCNTRLSACSDDDIVNQPSPQYVAIQDPNELGVELELEIDSCPPESPFSVDIIAAEHCDVPVFIE